MREGTRAIILALSLGGEGEDVIRQVLGYLEDDISDETICDVIGAFYVLSDRWHGADRCFAMLVQAFPDLWNEALAELTAAERLEAVIATQKALGVRVTKVPERIVELARAELARRTYLFPAETEVC